MNLKKQSAESKVKEIRRHTRKKYSAEEKIRIVIEGLRGESSIAERYHLTMKLSGMLLRQMCILVGQSR